MNPYQGYWPSGQIMRLEYKNDSGLLHNDSGPACREWYESGKIKRKIYAINGLLHNINAPAVCWGYESGQIYFVVYYMYGWCHNINGPAHYEWNEFGQLSEEEYYLRGKKLEVDRWRDLTKPAEILRVISLLPYPIAVEVCRYYCKA